MGWFDGLTRSVSPELLLAIYGTIVAPLLIALGNRISARLGERRERHRLIRYLAGLPNELKAVLVPYYVDGAHTLGGNPSDPAVAQLRHMGLIAVGVGRGTYDVVNAWLALRQDVFEVLDLLALKDQYFMESIQAAWTQREMERIAGERGELADEDPGDR